MTVQTFEFDIVNMQVQNWTVFECHDDINLKSASFDPPFGIDI